MALKDTSLPGIKISTILREKAEKRAKDLGMNLSEYIRYLIQRDTEEAK